MIIHIHEAPATQGDTTVAAKLTEHEANFQEVVQFVRQLEKNQTLIVEQLTQLAERATALTGPATDLTGAGQIDGDGVSEG